jgi:putative transposase
VAAAQQVLARKQRGSTNHRSARATLAARHRKVANQRRNFHHHTGRALVADYDLLVVEDLKIRNLVRRPAPRPDPDRPGGFLPNGAAAKGGCTEASTTRAGPSSCRSCAPKRKRLDVW